MNDLPTVHLPAFLAHEFGISRSEARRCIAQGGVKVDGQVTNDLDVTENGAEVTLGTRRSARLPNSWEFYADESGWG